MRVSRGKTHRGSRSLLLFLSSMQIRAPPDHVAQGAAGGSPAPPGHASVRACRRRRERAGEACARGASRPRECCFHRPGQLATACVVAPWRLRLRANAQRDKEAPDTGSRRSMTHSKTSKDNQYDVGSRSEGATACPRWRRAASPPARLAERRSGGAHAPRLRSLLPRSRARTHAAGGCRRDRTPSAPRGRPDAGATALLLEVAREPQPHRGEAQRHAEDRRPRSGPRAALSGPTPSWRH